MTGVAFDGPWEGRQIAKEGRWLLLQQANVNQHSHYVTIVVYRWDDAREGWTTDDEGFGLRQSPLR